MIAASVIAGLGLTAVTALSGPEASAAVSDLDGRITGAGSGRCVDVRAASTADETPVQLADCTDNAAQRWTGGPNRSIRALGKCLDVRRSGRTNGTQVQLFTCNGTRAQRWSIKPDGTIRALGKCLDATDFGTTNGTRLQMWDCHGLPNQIWAVSRAVPSPSLSDPSASPSGPSVSPSSPAPTPSTSSGPVATPSSPSATPSASPSTDGSRPVGMSGNFDLIFRDEFDGTRLDDSKWNVGYRWSQNVDGGPQTIINRESQYHHRNNVSVHDGVLDIVMKNETVQGQPFTSGAISSHDKFYFTYGIMEARIKIPAGDGLWPAFWAMFQDVSKPYKEIDVIEFSGKRPHEAVMTYHWEDGNSGSNLYHGPDYSTDFHTFAVEWSPTAIVWYIDGVERARFTDASKIVNHDMYLLLNMGMAPLDCSWVGCPDSSILPVHFLVDHVRVWKRA